MLSRLFYKGWLQNVSKLVSILYVLHVFHFVLSDCSKSFQFNIFILMPKWISFSFHSALSAEINQLALRSELPALPVASDSAVGNYSSNFVMDPSNTELIQRHLHEQRGHFEIHYHQNFLRGHVCVAGKNTNLNMQLPSTEQRSLEAGPSYASHKCLTAGPGTQEVWIITIHCKWTSSLAITGQFTPIMPWRQDQTALL